MRDRDHVDPSEPEDDRCGLIRPNIQFFAYTDAEAELWRDALGDECVTRIEPIEVVEDFIASVERFRQLDAEPEA